MTVSQIWSHIMLYSLYYSYNGHLTYPHLKFWGMEDLWAHFIQHFRFFSFFDKSCMSHNKCTWSCRLQGVILPRKWPIFMQLLDDLCSISRQPLERFWWNLLRSEIEWIQIRWFEILRLLSAKIHQNWP